MAQSSADELIEDAVPSWISRIDSGSDVEPPVVRYKVHEQVKKGEDFHLVNEVLTVRGTTSTLYCVSAQWLALRLSYHTILHYCASLTQRWHA